MEYRPPTHRAAAVEAVGRQRSLNRFPERIAGAGDPARAVSRAFSFCDAAVTSAAPPLLKSGKSAVAASAASESSPQQQLRTSSLLLPTPPSLSPDAKMSCSRAPCSSAATLLLLASLSLALLVRFGDAGVSIERVKENPEYPNHCKDSRLNQYFPNGATWQYPGLCRARVCQFPYISTLGCGSASVDPPCTLQADNTKPYPECCPQPVCPTDAENDLNTI